MVFYGCLTRPLVPAGRLGRVFAGPAGVRPLWCALLYLLLLALEMVVLTLVVLLLLHLFGPHKKIVILQLTPLYALLNEGLLLAAAVGAGVVMAWLEGHRLRHYGLAGRHKFRRLCQGFLAGLLMLSLLVGVLLFTGHAALVSGNFSGLAKLRFGVEWLFVALLIGLTEELLFRGYLLQTLRRGIGFWPAAVLTSLLFGGLHGHNPGETYVGLIDVMFAGLLLCLGIYWTKSLWWSIGLHGAWDFSENYIYGTPDSGVRCLGTLLNFSPRGDVLFSGGLTGPEGSLFSLAVIALTGALCWFWLRRLP